MQTSSFARKVAFICLALGLVVAGLSVALYNQGPRVRFIQNVDDVSSSALTAGSSMKIIFDRPIQQQDYTDLISIMPTVDFTAQTNTQGITLTIQSNLRSDTDYTISVMPEIYDKSGKKMKSSYEHSFMTPSPRYVYLERNYATDSGESSLSASAEPDDHIKLSTLEAEPEVIFSHPQIRSFAANSRYVVTVVKEEENDHLYTIDLHTKEVRREQPWSEGRVNNLALAPLGRTALFTTQPDYNAVSLEYYEQYANRIESLDLSDGTLLSLADMDGNPLKAYSIDTDAYGQIALIQDFTQSYRAISPFNDFEPVIIGSYPDTFGFSGDGAEILFRDREDLLRYDISSADITPIDLDMTGFVLDIKSLGDTINLSSTTYYPGLSYSQVERINNWSDDPSTIWRSEANSTSSLRNFTLSYDNDLLALQFDPDECQYVGLGPNSECSSVFQQIVVPGEQKILREFRGSSLVWLP